MSVLFGKELLNFTAMDMMEKTPEATTSWGDLQINEEEFQSQLTRKLRELIFQAVREVKQKSLTHIEKQKTNEAVEAMPISNTFSEYNEKPGHRAKLVAEIRRSFKLPQEYYAAHYDVDMDKLSVPAYLLEQMKPDADYERRFTLSDRLERWKLQRKQRSNGKFDTYFQHEISEELFRSVVEVSHFILYAICPRHLQKGRKSLKRTRSAVASISGGGEEIHSEPVVSAEEASAVEEFLAEAYSSLLKMHSKGDSPQNFKDGDDEAKEDTEDDDDQAKEDTDDGEAEEDTDDDERTKTDTTDDERTETDTNDDEKTETDKEGLSDHENNEKPGEDTQVLFDSQNNEKPEADTQVLPDSQKKEKPKEDTQVISDSQNNEKPEEETQVISDSQNNEKPVKDIDTGLLLFDSKTNEEDKEDLIIVLSDSDYNAEPEEDTECLSEASVTTVEESIDQEFDKLIDSFVNTVMRQDNKRKRSEEPREDFPSSDTSRKLLKKGIAPTSNIVAAIPEGSGKSSRAPFDNTVPVASVEVQKEILPVPANNPGEGGAVAEETCGGTFADLHNSNTIFPLPEPVQSAKSGEKEGAAAADMLKNALAIPAANPGEKKGAEAASMSESFADIFDPLDHIENLPEPYYDPDDENDLAACLVRLKNNGN